MKSNTGFNENFKPDIAHARFIRKKRSELKADLKSGKLKLKELISNKMEYYRLKFL